MFVNFIRIYAGICEQIWVDSDLLSNPVESGQDSLRVTHEALAKGHSRHAFGRVLFWAFCLRTLPAYGREKANKNHICSLFGEIVLAERIRENTWRALKIP